MRAELAAAYVQPSILRKDTPDLAPPRARTHCTHEVWKECLGKFDPAGMVELEREVDLPFWEGGVCVPRGRSSEKESCRGRHTDRDRARARSLVSGAFPVPKSKDVDRFISARTPANSQEISLGVSRELMPHASCFCELQVRAGESVRGSADDLPDFYHTEVCSRERARSNQIGYSYEWSELADLQCAKRFREREGKDFSRGHVVRAVQRTMPMGDRNATDYSQAAHLGVLRAGGACRPDEFLTYRGPVPRSRTWEGVMIDDHFVVQICKDALSAGRAKGSIKAGADCIERDTALLGAVDRAYAAAGLHPKPSKRVRGENLFEIIGGFIDGLAMKVSAKPSFLLLVSLVAAVVGVGADCSGLMMQTLASMFVHCFLFCRELLSLFGKVFAFIERTGGSRGSAGTLSALPLSGAARDEVLVGAVLLPLASTNIRAPVDQMIYASDAMGGVRPAVGLVGTVVPEAVASELWRHRNRRAAYVSPAGGPLAPSLQWLLADEWEFDALEGRHPLGDCRNDLDTKRSVENAANFQRNWVDPVARAAAWRCLVHFRQTQAEKIHCSEMRGVREGARSAVRRGVRNTRVLLLCDSTVCVGAVGKGRSSSVELNWLMRTFFFELLFCGIQLGILHVSSKANPADAPSRNEKTRVGPEASCERWASRFLEGHITEVDARLPPAHWERLVVPLGATARSAPPDQWHLSSDEFDLSRPPSALVERAAIALHARLRGDPLPEEQVELLYQKLVATGPPPRGAGPRSDRDTGLGRSKACCAHDGPAISASPAGGPRVRERSSESRLDPDALGIVEPQGPLRCECQWCHLPCCWNLARPGRMTCSLCAGQIADLPCRCDCGFDDGRVSARDSGLGVTSSACSAGDGPDTRGVSPTSAHQIVLLERMSWSWSVQYLVPSGREADARYGPASDRGDHVEVGALGAAVLFRRLDGSVKACTDAQLGSVVLRCDWFRDLGHSTRFARLRDSDGAVLLSTARDSAADAPYAHFTLRWRGFGPDPVFSPWDDDEDGPPDAGTGARSEARWSRRSRSPRGRPASVLRDNCKSCERDGGDSSSEGSSDSLPALCEAPHWRDVLAPGVELPEVTWLPGLIDSLSRWEIGETAFERPVRDRSRSPPPRAAGPRSERDSGLGRSKACSAFDGPLGEPLLGPGAGRAAPNRRGRPGRGLTRDTSVDLRTKPSRPEEAKAKRTVLRDKFADWCLFRGTSIEILTEGSDHVPLAEALREYGHHLWKSRGAQGEFSATIGAVIDLRRDWGGRNRMTVAWDLYTEWKIAEPSLPTMPLPLPAIRAAVCIALLILDFEFAAVSLVGFVGGLRIGEVLKLRRSDIVLPQDQLFEAGRGRRPIVFIIIRDSKNSKRGGAPVQHAVIDDPQTVAFLVWWFTPFAPTQELFEGDDVKWEARWKAVLTGRLGILTNAETGFPPNCLRASHSTESYLLHADLDRIRWQLRHRATRMETLEHYIQELPAALARASWSAGTREIVERFSGRADGVLAAASLGLLGTVSVPARMPGLRAYHPRARAAEPVRGRGLTRELAALQDQNAGFEESVYWPKRVAGLHAA